MKLLSKRIEKIIRSGFTQAQIARAAKVSPTAVHLWLKGGPEGTRTIKMEQAKGIEKTLGFRAEWIATGEPPERVADTSLGLSLTPKLAEYDDEKIVTVQPYERDDNTDLEPAIYRLGWFQRRNINPERTYSIRVTGERMEPLLFDGDYALVNTDETGIIEGKMYALDVSDGIIIGYISKKLDGSLVIRSLNPKYSDEIIPPNQSMNIIGRVRDASGSGGT